MYISPSKEAGPRPQIRFRLLCLLLLISIGVDQDVGLLSASKLDMRESLNLMC